MNRGARSTGLCRKKRLYRSNPKKVSISSSSHQEKIGAIVEQGEISALMVPHPPEQALKGSPKIRRLFGDPKQEELKYFRKNGYYPIMHVVAFKDEILAQDPWLAQNVMAAFDKAKEACVAYYDDPNWSR